MIQTYADALESAKVLNARHQDFDRLFYAAWGDGNRGYIVLQRAYTPTEQQMIASGRLMPIEDQKPDED